MFTHYVERTTLEALILASPTSRYANKHKSYRAPHLLALFTFPRGYGSLALDVCSSPCFLSIFSSNCTSS